MVSDNNILPSGDNTGHKDSIDKILQTAESVDRPVKPLRLILPAAIMLLILLIMCIFSFRLREETITNVEHTTKQIADSIANSIVTDLDFAQSSIKLSAMTVSQTMTSANLENPNAVIAPMIKNTPFGGIEYIRADGMNVMNIGEPFDATDRVYYKEGIKGNTGIWNNYHPKTSEETLINIYTPLMYNNEIAGVITGYIKASSQLTPLFETTVFEQPIHGLLLDENNMVICTTYQQRFVKDYNLEMFMDHFNGSSEQKQEIRKSIVETKDAVISFRDYNGNGRLCVSTLPDTGWKVVIIVPSQSFNEIVNHNTRDAAIAIVVITLILMVYASYILIRNEKIRKNIAIKNLQLEETNRHNIAEITEIRDIIASAHMGTWRIELIEGEEPRMYVDKTMKKLLGISDMKRSPEETYNDWFTRIKPEAVPSVLESVERMQKGRFDENTYLWLHPKKGERYVRCGGTSQRVYGGFVLKGYHYDVDEVVREDQEKNEILMETLDTKNEYYSILGNIGDLFYSIHVLDLLNDTVTEYISKNNVKELVNKKNGATEMMQRAMEATMSPDYLEAALEFTDLRTLPDRMKGKKVMFKELMGNSIGWVKAGFIVMEADSEQRPTKVIFTTRDIDEEKKQTQSLINITQTDELTGLFNRRAYEEDIYENNDIPQEEHFVYVSLDVNGLKVVNDTLGHTAGDELIIGACQCMRASLGAYGKLFRIGGDEFVAIMHCDDQRANEIFEDFDATITSWSGDLVESLSISYGWASKTECPDASVRELGTIAEKRMYMDKEAHYRKKGVDRRGQKDAHKALCELYTKILKVNISEDTFQIVNMATEEQAPDKGYSAKISEWLADFARKGNVHPDDAEEYMKATDIQYLREYFAANKTSLHVFYRRKYAEDNYKQVMMELIPAGDYSHDNQSLFLYVKDIDK